MQVLRRLLDLVWNLAVPVALAVLIAVVFAMVNSATRGPESQRDMQFQQVREVSEHAETVRQMMQDAHEQQTAELEQQLAEKDREIDELRKRLGD